MSACCGEGECASKERGVCEDKKVLVYGMVEVVARRGVINTAIRVTDKPHIQKL